MLVNIPYMEHMGIAMIQLNQVPTSNCCAATGTCRWYASQRQTAWNLPKTQCTQLQCRKNTICGDGFSIATGCNCFRPNSSGRSLMRVKQCHFYHSHFPGNDQFKNHQPKNAEFFLGDGARVYGIVLPSGKHTKSYWKWPIEIVDFPMKNGDFP